MLAYDAVWFGFPHLHYIAVHQSFDGSPAMGNLIRCFDVARALEINPLLNLKPLALTKIKNSNKQLSYLLTVPLYLLRGHLKYLLLSFLHNLL